MKKILMLVRTSGLEYDDRVRKEILSLNKLGYSIDILANYTSNKPQKGYTSYGTSFKVFKLYTRTLFPSSKLLPIKMMEFWLRVFFNSLFKKYEYVWLHEEYMFLNALIKPVKGKYILDLHELPAIILKKRKGVRIYKKIERNVFKLIVANEERLSHMVKIGLISNAKKYIILNNYPDSVFGNIEKRHLPLAVSEFLNGSDYVLLQGGGHISRYPKEVLKAIQETNKLKIIIVGPIHPEIEKLINKEYSDLVYKTGYVKQLELPMFFDHAKFTIILYNSDEPNSLYCEPNRLYQAINRGIPVITGSNPPMKNIVETDNIGVVLKTDGRDWVDIYNSISIMYNNYNFYKDTVIKSSKKYQWENQNFKFTKLLNE